MESECKCQIKSNGITLTLVKKDKVENWTDLKPKKSLVNTQKFKETNDEGLGDLMGMMKDMYQNGDDDMKKMMAESWAKG